MVAIPPGTAAGMVSDTSVAAIPLGTAAGIVSATSVAAIPPGIPFRTSAVMVRSTPVLVISVLAR